MAKYECTRDSRVIVYAAGGFTGGLIGPLLDLTLENVSDQDFMRVKEIIDLLQTPKTHLEYLNGGGDFGYYVEAGDKDVDEKRMNKIFRGGPFTRTPVIVDELRSILTSNNAGQNATPAEIARAPKRKKSPGVTPAG